MRRPNPYVILSRSGAEAKNPYDEPNNGIVSGTVRRFAPQSDMFFNEAMTQRRRT
jgi:hypothetical protein